MTTLKDLCKDVECMICHVHKGNLINHVRLIHNISCKEYKMKYHSQILSEYEINRLKNRMNLKINGVKVSKIISDKGVDNRNEWLSKENNKDILRNRIAKGRKNINLEESSNRMKLMRKDDSELKRSVLNKCIFCGELFSIDDLGWNKRSFSVEKFKNVYFCSRKCRNLAIKGKFGVSWSKYMKNLLNFKKIYENT